MASQHATVKLPPLKFGGQNKNKINKKVFLFTEETTKKQKQKRTDGESRSKIKHQRTVGRFYSTAIDKVREGKLGYLLHRSLRGTLSPFSWS
jgi:hypothetical protein